MSSPREPLLSKTLTTAQKWKWGAGIAALLMLGVFIQEQIDRPKAPAGASITTEAVDSDKLAEEATDIYNTYIAAARLCRSAGERGIEATGADPISAYEALIRAQRTCDESANRISGMQASEIFAAETRKTFDDLRLECARTHRLLARVYGKVAKLLDKGGGASQLVETRDLLREGRDAEESCHARLAEAVKAAGGQVLDR